MSAITGDDDPSPEFPAGLRVLVVDHDPVHLKRLNDMLLECKYEVTTCMESATALSLLHEKEGEFDLVLSDFDMPDMKGDDFLRCIRQEFENLAVVLMSKDYRFDDVRRGMKNGALYHFIKPISKETLRTIWITVMMGRKNDIKDEKEERKNEEEHKMQYEERDRSPLNNKKRRVVWCDRLHAKFEAAVQQLGIDKAVPKKILELMDEPLLTRENVASHLQKHRAGMKKGSGSGSGASILEVVRDVGPCNIRSQLPSEVQGNRPLVPMNTQVQSCNSGAQLANPLNIRPPAFNQRNYISSNNIGHFIPTPQRQQPLQYQNIGQLPALQYQNIGQLPAPRYQNIGQQPVPQYAGASQFLDMPVTYSPGEQHVLQQQITSGHQALIPHDGNHTNSEVGSIRDHQFYFLSKLHGRPVTEELKDWKIALVLPQLDNNQLIGDDKSTPSNDDTLHADDIFDILEARD